MTENGQSEVGSVSNEIMKNDKQNVKNGVSGLKEVTTESLDTNSRKKTFKIFNISKTSSSKTSSSKQSKFNSTQTILPAVSTPTKQS